MKLIVPNIRLYQARQQLHSDQAFAKALGWSKSKLSRVLSGKQGVNDVLLKDLVRVLGCKEGEIVELEDVAQTDFQRAVTLAAKRATPEQEAILRAMFNIPPDVPSDR